MFLDLGMLLDVAIVAGKVDAMHAGMHSRARIATGKAKA